MLAAILAMAGGIARGSGAEDPGSVSSASTGDNSELVRVLPIASRAEAFRPVLRLPRTQMPSLKPHDELRVSAEVSVTTDCTKPAPRCTGNPYTYDPRITTQIVLTSPAGDVVLARDRRACVQQPGDRQHHCVIPYHGVQAGNAAARLGCEEGGCGLEMLMSVSNPSARPGEVLIIGGQDETGKLRQDKARLNAIRLRGRPERLLVETPLERKEVPPDLDKRVVLSQKLDDLQRGDVVESFVDLRASVAHLPYPALVSSQIVLAESPRATHGKRFVSRVANLRGELTESGGTNCTQAQTPCPVFRTGVLKMRESSETPRGRQVPLFLNVVVRANNKLKPERPGDMIRLFDNSGLRTTVYRGS